MTHDELKASWEELLDVALDEGEQADHGRKLASLLEEKHQIEAKKKDAAKNFKDELDDLEISIEIEAMVVTKRAEPRMVEVEPRYTNENNTREVVRLDTGEIVSKLTRATTPSERTALNQGQLFDKALTDVQEETARIDKARGSGKAPKLAKLPLNPPKQLKNLEIKALGESDLMPMVEEELGDNQENETVERVWEEASDLLKCRILACGYRNTEGGDASKTKKWLAQIPLRVAKADKEALE